MINRFEQIKQKYNKIYLDIMMSRLTYLKSQRLGLFIWLTFGLTQNGMQIHL